MQYLILNLSIILFSIFPYYDRKNDLIVVLPTDKKSAGN